jgi:molybdate transport system ATP-binding protein
MTSGLTVQAVVERGEFRLELDFSAAPGEVLGILGPNGAGKSTLVRTLAGLTALTEGRISLDDVVFDDVATSTFVSASARPVGLVFQNYRLFPHLSVRDNVAFGPRAHRVNRAEANAQAQTWLDRFGLAEFAGRKPGALSGGQAQRVALARALAAQPQLLLLDEPLAALDARTRLDVRSELRRQLADFSGPTLLITHDALDAMVLADRLLVIEDGRIVQQGSPAEVARRPETNYVARLVGLNLYRGARRGTHVIVDGGGSLIVPADPNDTDDEAVLVAIRPSAIALHTSPPENASPRNVWAGRVAGLESLTDRVRVEVTGEPSALVDITPDAVADLGLVAGTAVWLSAKATDVDVYPAVSSV